MDSLKEKVESAKNVFARAHCAIELVDGNIIRASNSNFDRRYRIPELTAANNFRLPGWYWAGIWDDMGMPNMGSYIDYISSGWGFQMMGQSGLWYKTLPDDNHLKLFFQPGVNQFYIENEFGHKENVAILPTRSLFHIIKLLEENNWFGSGETRVQTQSINGYTVTGS